MDDLPIVKFPHKNLNLSDSEKKVVSLLVKAAQAIAPIYKKQADHKNSGANLYPRDATKKEIFEAAKRDKEILSPYSVVERDKKGKLISIPFHLKFKDDLEIVVSYLRQAAKFSDNREFVRRLEVQANSLLEGTYETSDIYWLSLKPYKINFVIGPIERYDDKLFFTKCSYQAWVGIMDKKQTEDAKRFRDYIVSSRRKVLVPSEKVDFLDKIQIRVDDTLIFSGLIARFMFTSTNLPNDVNLMERYGSEITIFKPSSDSKFKNERFKIFQSIFEKKFQQSYPEELLKRAEMRNCFLHEISHPMLRYRDSESRLREYFPIFDEICASIFGVRTCGSLLLKDVISQKELEAIMVMFITRAFSWWLSYLKEPSVIHYAQGFAIALNFFLENGAIRGNGGFSWPNFTKLFVSIDDLTDAMERILALGTYEDAQKFVDKYASLEIYKRFANNLNKLL